MNLAMLLDMAVDAFGERAALKCAGRELQYGQLRTAALAAAAQARSVSHLALLDTHSAATAVALFAAAYAGVPYVPLNYRLSAAELTQLLERIAPAWLIAPTAQQKVLALPQGIRCSASEALLCGATGTAAPVELAAAEDAIAIELFTSGTSGKPKAALLKHANLMAYILGTVEFGCAGCEEAALLAVPPYHIAGITALLSSTYAGRRLVMLPAFEPAEWVRLALNEAITQAFLVPTMLVRIMDYLAGQGAVRLPALRAIAYGGGRMPRSVLERALQMFAGVDFTNAYGLTETSATVCLLTPEDHRAALAAQDPEARQRLSSVGRALPGIELEVRDESGRRLAARQPGLIFVRGAQVAGSYRDRGSLLDAHGWFATQDRGWIDADGYVFLDGRADDVIVRGGENISPGEVEETLLQHAAVADAVVVAVASEEWGETVAAAVVLKAGAAATTQDLRDWVRERLRSSRVPERIVLRSELPYNEMGKVLRRVVRSELEQT
jgi:long-chain acyl-CoA synthetase